MDEQAKADAVAEMAARRIAARQADLRRTIALRLLNANGSVSAAEIEDRFAVEWADTDPQALADQVVAKAEAAVDFHRRQAEAAEAAVVAVEGKVAKFEALLERARADLDNARMGPDAAVGELADAHEIAEYAGRNGLAARAPAPKRTEAAAGVATAQGSA